MNECTTISVQGINDLPIDDLESTPDFFIAVREIPDATTGNIIPTFTRVPGNKLFPSGNLDNVFALEANNTSLTIPENQVVGCYVQNDGSRNIVMPATTSNPAQFVVFQIQGTQALCQSTGALNILGGHNYIVGMTYYQGANGMPTTTPSSQKMFYVASNTKLILKM